jgi:hypothetical protein
LGSNPEKSFIVEFLFNMFISKGSRGQRRRRKSIQHCSGKYLGKQQAPQGLVANLVGENTLVTQKHLDNDHILSYLAHQNPCSFSQNQEIPL